MKKTKITTVSKIKEFQFETELKKSSAIVTLTVNFTTRKFKIKSNMRGDVGKSEEWYNAKFKMIKEATLFAKEKLNLS
jgi:hypothetical protein